MCRRNSPVLAMVNWGRGGGRGSRRARSAAGKQLARSCGAEGCQTQPRGHSFDAHNTPRLRVRFGGVFFFIFYTHFSSMTLAGSGDISNKTCCCSEIIATMLCIWSVVRARPTSTKTGLVIVQISIYCRVAPTIESHATTQQTSVFAYLK